jgi:hypothetical protein
MRVYVYQELIFRHSFQVDGWIELGHGCLEMRAEGIQTASNASVKEKECDSSFEDGETRKLY